MYRFIIGELTPTYNKYIRMHFHQRGKLRDMFYDEMRGQLLNSKKFPPVKPMLKCSLFLSRYSTREPDYDGLVGSFKIVVDLLQPDYLNIIIDDSLSVTGKWHCDWFKCKRKDQRTEIVVVER